MIGTNVPGIAIPFKQYGFGVVIEDESTDSIKKAIEYKGPVMIDFICESFEMVYPWVLAGDSIDKVLLSREGC